MVLQYLGEIDPYSLLVSVSFVCLSPSTLCAGLRMTFARRMGKYGVSPMWPSHPGTPSQRHGLIVALPSRSIAAYLSPSYPRPQAPQVCKQWRKVCETYVVYIFSMSSAFLHSARASGSGMPACITTHIRHHVDHLDCMMCVEAPRRFLFTFSAALGMEWEKGRKY